MQYLLTKVVDMKNKKAKKETIESLEIMIQKYPEEAELFATHYREKTIVYTYDGVIDFDPEG